MSLTLDSLSALRLLSRNETMRNIAHDIRCLCAVWSPDTGRFHPDRREEKTISASGKILSNLFSRGTALVVSQNGTPNVVVSRGAERAAACIALRQLRSGIVPSHTFHVTQRNRSGQSYNETVFIGFDGGSSWDNRDGDEKANVVVSEMGHVSEKRIDDLILE